MTTKEEIITNLKKEYPTIKIGDDEQGYIYLNETEYEYMIKEWADNILADQLRAEMTAKAEADKTAAQAKLAALGLTTDDLKALGL